MGGMIAQTRVLNRQLCMGACGVPQLGFCGTVGVGVCEWEGRGWVLCRCL